MEMPWSIGEVSWPFLTSSLTFQESSFGEREGSRAAKNWHGELSGCFGAVCQ